MIGERWSLWVLAVLLFVLVGAAVAQPDGADIMIRDGTIVATAADYEMDGTMWAAFTRLEDSNTCVYRSTDRGLSWERRTTTSLGGELAEKLGLVVGEGDSGFVYLFLLDPRNDGDLLCVRATRDGSSIITFPVAVGPDTIRDFAVCRDYTGSNYWLYAVATNPDPPANNRALRFLRSSTYGRNWAVVDSYGYQVYDPHLAAGAQSHIYFTAHGDWSGGVVHQWMNPSYLDPSNWYRHFCYTDSQEVGDPVIAAAFTLPESTTTVWALWSQNYMNSGDWDLMYRFSTDGGSNWSTPDFLAGSAAADEGFPDLRDYTSPGNQYINASYISDDDAYRSVYRRYAHAATPDQWSDTLRINEGSAGTGSEIRPKLCYTPGGPFSGAGCVFVGAGLNGCWWNAPYPTSVTEPTTASVEGRVMSVQPSIGRGPFRIRVTSPASVSIHDRAGRIVRGLVPDVAGEAPWDGHDELGQLLPDGVYFVRFTAGDYRATEKLVLQR